LAALSSLGATCDAGWEKAAGGMLASVIYLMIVSYIFLGVAILCDGQFADSLDMLCSKRGLHLSNDIAGATFMAAGSSAPELAASFVGTFITNDEVGLGTILGSAVFNMLVIIGISAVGAGVTLHLDWRPLARDNFFYILCVVVMSICIASDSSIQWYDGVLLVTTYILYLGFMFINQDFWDYVAPKGSPTGSPTATGDDSSNQVSLEMDERNIQWGGGLPNSQEWLQQGPQRAADPNMQTRLEREMGFTIIALEERLQRMEQKNRQDAVRLSPRSGPPRPNDPHRNLQFPQPHHQQHQQHQQQGEGQVGVGVGNGMEAMLALPGPGQGPANYRQADYPQQTAAGSTAGHGLSRSQYGTGSGGGGPLPDPYHQSMVPYEPQGSPPPTVGDPYGLRAQGAASPEVRKEQALNELERHSDCSKKHVYLIAHEVN